MRTTFAQFRQSFIPGRLGLCASSVPELISYCNEAQLRLLFAGGETGWFDCWQKVIFNVSRSSPYITLPRQFARIINMDVCCTPIYIQNEFYEFLPGNPGLYNDLSCKADWCGNIQGFERGLVPTMVDLDSSNQLLRVYAVNSTDAGKRILIKGLDQNGLVIRSMDGVNSIEGFIMSLTTPFTDSTFVVTKITGIEKDMTLGDVLLFQVDQTTGVQKMLSRFAPDERTPSYRRYYISALPDNCCNGNGTVQVTALAKLEYVPVTQDTDILIIGNLVALCEECLSIRFGNMDNPEAAKLSLLKHNLAIKQLQNEQRHYMGEQQIAVSVDIGMGIEKIGQLI